jgi:uncharacterized integral membrane protein
MNIRAFLYLATALVIGALVVANWALFTSQVELNFIVARVQAPLVILLLLVVAVVSLMDVLVHVLSHSAWRRERRTLKSDLDAARLRADREDESRIGTLRITLEREFATIHAQLDQLSEGQSALLTAWSNERLTTPRPTETTTSRRFEPELVPPRIDAG